MGKDIKDSISLNVKYNGIALNLKDNNIDRGSSLVSSIIKTIDNYRSKNDPEYTHTEPLNNLNTLNHTPNTDDFSFKIRQGIPQSEVIKNMKKKSGKEEEENPTESVNSEGNTTKLYKKFMCPNCKQHKSIIINDSLVVKDVETDVLYMLNDDNSNLKNKEIYEIFKDDQKAASIISADNVGILSCNNLYMGKCNECGETYSTEQWIDQYKNGNPDSICPLCGNELLLSISSENVGDNNTTVYKCDNDECDYTVKKEMPINETI